VAYVNRAADVVSQRGADCPTFEESGWFAGDWYIFVLEPNGKTVCHPARPDMVGTMASDVVDPNGKRIGEEFMRAPAAGGWVEYVWARPGQTTPVAKSAYVRQVTAPDGKTYVVGSGGYEVP
ncbi:MAG TPA: cache domain-containing protein, partial [Thermoanaerobaculia bacterium]